MSDAYLCLRDVVKSYDGRVNAVDGISIDVRRGEFLTLLGPSGSGKTTTLLMIADYDTVARELKNLRYDDGLPVAADRIAELAAQAKILPAIFNAEGDPLWLGRTQRDASAGQRIVLAARDGGCVNCAAPAEAGEPHHIRWFSRGGPTDIDNLALLCERCHHLTHDDGWELNKRNGHHKLRPPPKRPDPAARPRSEHNPILRT